jgi:hypothetical protein
MDVAEKTIKKIEEENIVPKARWHFMLKDYSIWLFFVLSVIVGAIAVSAIIFMLTTNDWDIYGNLGRSLVEHIFISMPYFWILILLVFILAAYNNFKYTRLGYRYEMYLIILGSILISLFLGLIIFLSGFGESIHNIFMEQIPFYNNLVSDRKNVWSNPQKGLLGGQITEVKNQNEFMIKDFTGKNWTIEKESQKCCSPELVRSGNLVEMIGILSPDNIFIVKEMRPWYGGCCHR